MLRNVKIARELELNTPENLALMKEGRTPIVGAGPYTGEEIKVDYIVPRSLAPDLKSLLINLEMMTLNRRKSDKVTERVAATAEKLFTAGMMMQTGWDSVSRLPK